MIPRPIDLRVPRAFTALAIGLGSGALAGPTVRAVLPASSFVGIDHALLWSVGLSTALCSALATAIVMRRGAVARPGGVIAWFAAAGVLASGLGLFALAGLQGTLNPIFILAGALGGALVAVPLGATIGVLALPTLLALDRLRRNPSLAGRLGHLAGVGTWLAGAGLLALAVSSNHVTLLLAQTSLALGAVAALGAGIAHAIGTRWIAFVAANRVPGWTLRDPAEVDVPLGLPRWSDRPDPSGQRAAILCRILGADRLEARARIPAVLVAPA